MGAFKLHGTLAVRTAPSAAMAAPEGAALEMEMPVAPPCFSAKLRDALGQATGVPGPQTAGAAQALCDAVFNCPALGPGAKNFVKQLNTCGWPDCSSLPR